MPEPKDLHVDAVLTSLSIKYTNEELIWPMLMPIVNVNKRSDVYYVRNKEDAYRVVNDDLGPKGVPNELDWATGTDNYSVKGHGLGDWLPQETIENSDPPLQAEITTNESLNDALSLAQEVRVAGIVHAAATYPAGNKVQLSGTGQWSGSADAPIADVQTAIETCFIRANTLVFGLDAWLVFRRLPEIVEAVRAGTRASGPVQQGFVTAPEVASLFEVDRVIVGRARKGTNKKGQTFTHARVWGKHMAALHVMEGVGLNTIAFGKTFVQTPRQTMRDFDPKRGESGAHYLKVAWNSDEKVVASDLGYLIEDAVA